MNNKFVAFAFDGVIQAVNLQAVLSRLSKWFVVSTLIFSLGAHWAILQSVAWVGMVVSYSHDAPFTEALSKTFDGQHPCKLCKFVEAGKAKEQKQEKQKPVTKLEFPLFAQQPSLRAPQLEPMAFAVSLSHGVSSDSPPTPPPERA